VPETIGIVADLYDRNGQYTEAIDAYKKVIELKPDMGYAYFKMGTATIV
jgi:tetratricopeptide (TPR) repeat protein